MPLSRIDVNTVFGLAALGVGSPELGWNWLLELINLRGRLGFAVERD